VLGIPSSEPPVPVVDVVAVVDVTTDDDDDETLLLVIAVLVPPAPPLPMGSGVVTSVHAATAAGIRARRAGRASG
jgi:hypothetical protein